MELKGFFKERIQILLEEFSSYKRYKNRICSVCGKHVDKNDGFEAVSSFSIIHKECLYKSK